MKERGDGLLRGTFADIYYNGLRIIGCSKIEAKITVNREEVQIGEDIDSSIVSLKGEGTISINRFYSAFENVREEICAGRDPRGTIITKLEDPNAVGGQIERYQINNVALNEFTVAYEKGAVVKSEFPFGFPPSDMINLDKIEEK